MDAQSFLANRINDIKGLISGEASLQDTATFLAPGGIGGKGGARGGLSILRSAGKPNASKMSLLGGDAPVYESNVEEVLDTPVRELLPGAVGSIGHLQSRM